MKNALSWLASVPLLCAQGAWAAPATPAAIHTLIEDFMHRQTESLPGKVSIQVGELDPRLTLPACAKPEAFLPPGGQLIGNGTVGVRCPGDKRSRSLFVPVRVTVGTRLVIAGKPLQLGQTLTAADLAAQDGEMSEISMLTDPAQAIGKVLKYSLAPGQVLRQDMLRAPYVVTQGQTVKIRADGEGFSVRSTGQALNNASPGEMVRIKTSAGRVVSGLAQADGSVSVIP